MKIKIITELDWDPKEQHSWQIENRIRDALFYLDGVDKTSIKTTVIFKKGPD